jgi:hypothetical protein
VILFGRRKGLHRRRRSWRRQPEAWPGHREWTVLELKAFREGAVAAIGARHGTEGWPT